MENFTSYGTDVNSSPLFDNKKKMAMCLVHRAMRSRAHLEHMETARLLRVITMDTVVIQLEAGPVVCARLAMPMSTSAYRDVAGISADCARPVRVELGEYDTGKYMFIGSRMDVEVLDGGLDNTTAYKRIKVVKF